MKILPFDYYQTADILRGAQDLLGKVLVTTVGGIRTSGIIVEAEAYRAPDDLACHASRFAHTPRGAAMFAAGGAAYVYFCRNQPLFNILFAPEGMAHCVLIRAVEPLEGIETMQIRRHFPKKHGDLTAGPAKLTQALGIEVATMHGVSLDGTAGIWLEDHNILYEKISISPRIRVEGAGVAAASLLWRFFAEGNVFVSEKNYFK